MRVLVIGAYGLIGSAVTAALIARGHEVTGLGRSVAGPARRWPAARWIARDLRAMRTPEDWRPLLAGIDAVVNAAGVLQDGPDDDVAAVQFDAMRALFAACESACLRRVVQISAVGAGPAASTRFMATKARADAVLAGSGLDYIILRPGLVLGTPAYGATALLRALAAFPLVLPIGAGDALIQTVALEEVAEAVAAAVDGALPPCRTFDLVEAPPHRLRDLVIALRAWLGLPPARCITVPDRLLRLLFRCGDAAGRLGWRTPARTTALRQIEASIVGDPAAWCAATGRTFSPLAATLLRMPASVQERWFARLWLLKPLIVGVLALFWITSGLVGLLQERAAADILTTHGIAPASADAAVLMGSAVDILLGLAVLVRAVLRPALLGMIGATLVYLVCGTVLAPGLWADPLGPFVKAVPGLVLALVALAIAGDR